MVVNCAGPYLDTALPLASAAIDVGAHYLDLAAEQAAVLELYRELDAPAAAAGVAVVPAMAFYGGLADLLVTAALGGSSDIEEISIAIWLDHWWPTSGTRTTGKRNTAPRLIVLDGELAPLKEAATARSWVFPRPVGERMVVEMPFSEVATITRHLSVQDMRSYLAANALADIRDPSNPRLLLLTPLVDRRSGSSSMCGYVKVAAP